jgi:hypothetical protein
MKVRIAKCVLDNAQPLEVMADPGLRGHADAAMDLDRLPADEFQRLADLHLRRHDRGGVSPGVVEIASHGREHRHAAGPLGGDENVGGAVLQGLEGADGDAELGSCLEIVDGGLERFIHRPDGFGA